MEGSNQITSWCNVVLTQWFNLASSVGMVNKLLSISPFVMQVPFVALKSILSNYFCITTCFKSLFPKRPICTYCLIYICVLCFAIFLVNVPQKGYISSKTRFYVGENWHQGATSNFNISKGLQRSCLIA